MGNHAILFPKPPFSHSGKTEECSYCHLYKNILQGIHWSTPSVLQHSITQAHDLGLSCAAMLPSLQDLDTLQVEWQPILSVTMFAPLASCFALLCAPQKQATVPYYAGFEGLDGHKLMHASPS